MNLNIKVLDKSVRDLYLNHETYYEGDSGLDLFIPEDVVVKSRGTVMINLKIACEGFKNNKPTSYYLYPRSSIVKTPLRLANSVGIIDSGYRGPIICALDNISELEYVIKKGTRLVQICGPSLEPITFKIKSELTSTSRGSNGLGSTGN
tara:strand:+ start:137 stop:583 length:447 start_codon:yes stop_codon:yes gene_type:complete